MATATGTWSGYSFIRTRAECYEISADAANNRSLMRMDIYVDTSQWLSADKTNFYAHTGASWSFGYKQFPVGSTYIGTTDFWVGHNNDGSGSAYFAASHNGTFGGSSSLSGYAPMTDFVRAPTSTAAPTYDARQSGSSTIKMYSSGTAPDRPAIDYFRWRVYPSGGTTGSFSSDQYSPWTWTGANYGTDYYVTAQAHSSEGFGPESSGTWMYAAPYINSISLPATGVVGKPYSGSITGTQVSSYSVASGTFPPGLSFSGSSVVGTPTLPGIYNFTIRATRDGVSSVDSGPQTIQILAGGPWINLGPTPWTTNTISNVSVNNNVVTVTTGTNHGLSELNQPITISGVTGAQDWLNGNWVVTAWTNNTLSFAATRANLSSTSVSGNLSVTWKRTSIFVRVDGQWKQAYMRRYNVNTGQWDYTA